jgi:hypothetical protein
MAKKKKPLLVRIGLWLIGDKNYNPRGPRKKKGKEEGKDDNK